MKEESILQLYISYLNILKGKSSFFVRIFFPFCKLLWIKTSAKNINVKKKKRLNVYLNL